jgi:hypothetical protein
MARKQTLYSPLEMPSFCPLVRRKGGAAHAAKREFLFTFPLFYSEGRWLLVRLSNRLRRLRRGSPLGPTKGWIDEQKSSGARIVSAF